MAFLIPVQYHNRNYPEGIKPIIEEIAGHFDATPISDITSYSLHTEYSYASRQFSSPALSDLEMIKNSQIRGIPQLWFNELWVKQFSTYIRHFANKYPPKIIEIHPPFTNYCPNITDFISLYRIFEELIIENYPDTQILIENRTGSRNQFPFLVSSATDLLNLTEKIEHYSLKLKIAFDPIQILTECERSQNLDEKAITRSISSLKICSKYFYALHLWGKIFNKNGKRVSHVGNLNTYFGNVKLKEFFLDTLLDIFNDNVHRYFIPEVNSNDKDLFSIISDLLPRFSFI